MDGKRSPPSPSISQMTSRPGVRHSDVIHGASSQDRNAPSIDRLNFPNGTLQRPDPADDA
jgi:hypothetical protein